MKIEKKHKHFWPFGRPWSFSLS